MPKISPKPSLQELVGRVESAGAALGEKATSLSDLIASIDSRLQEMPGKAPAKVSAGAESISFDRYSRWGLWLFDEDCDLNPGGDRCPAALTNVSISRKARAFPLLVDLLLLIESEQKRQASEIDEAFAALSRHVEGN